MKFCVFILTALLTHQLLLAQLTYTDLMQKPIGHNIATSTVWRYAMKKPIEYIEKNTKMDTVFNNNGSIKSINTLHWTCKHSSANVGYCDTLLVNEVDSFFYDDGSLKETNAYGKQYDRSSADFDYPDTSIEEKNIYNHKGLLVNTLEPYHIHVDQPCTLKVNYVYDEKNRVVLEDVFECDTMVHKKIITKYNDTAKQQCTTIIEEQEVSYYYIEQFDKKGKLIERATYSDNESSPDFMSKYNYLKHGRIIKCDRYRSRKKEDTRYTYYNKQHKKIKEITVKDIKLDSLAPNDTTVTEAEYFYYDKKGNLIRQDRFDKNAHVLVETNTYQYNAQNNLIYKREQNSRYESDRISKYYYRKDGLLDYYDVFYKDITITRYKYEYTFYK